MSDPEADLTDYDIRKKFLIKCAENYETVLAEIEGGADVDPSVDTLLDRLEHDYTDAFLLHFGGSFSNEKTLRLSLGALHPEGSAIVKVVGDRLADVVAKKLPFDHDVRKSEEKTFMGVFKSKKRPDPIAFSRHSKNMSAEVFELGRADGSVAPRVLLTRDKNKEGQHLCISTLPGSSEQLTEIDVVNIIRAQDDAGGAPKLLGGKMTHYLHITPEATEAHEQLFIIDPHKQFDGDELIKEELDVIAAGLERIYATNVVKLIEEHGLDQSLHSTVRTQIADDIDATVTEDMPSF